MKTPETIFEIEAMPHVDSLFRTAVRLLGDRGVAEDAVQEVYLEAWKSFGRYQPGTNCRAWLYKILFHVIQHHRRRLYRLSTRFVSEGQEAVETAVAYVPPVPEHLRDEEILAALDRTPDVYREAIVLVDVEGFSYKEAAETLQVPIGTVMSRLSRGRQYLRGELAGAAAGYGIPVTRQLSQPV